MALGEGDSIHGTEDIDALEAGLLPGTSGTETTPRRSGDVLLYPPVPNPFNPSTAIGFEIRVRADVSLTIYDVRGGMVAVLVNESLPAGQHLVTWDGRRGDGTVLPSGVYFARIDALGATRTQKLVSTK